MSTFKVCVQKIEEVSPHPNADRLDLIKVLDWRCVTGKGNFKVGDLAIYIPIDSILPPEVEAILFGPETKIKLNNSRVKTIKLRGAISQGMCVRPAELGFPFAKEGADLTFALNISKYEPPAKAILQQGKSTSKQSNPHFRKYTAIENAKNYPDVFKDTDIVSVTEKIHGTNFRAGYVPFYANTFWKKLKKFLGFAPEYEFVYGSHNVQLQDRIFNRGYYPINVYEEACMTYGLQHILMPGEVVYGEVYGNGIQKNYSYGLTTGLTRLVLFDVQIEEKYLDTLAFRSWAEARKLPQVPELYRGKFDKTKILELTRGSSVLAPAQKVREGVVVKPLIEESAYIGRKMLKFISDDYLLKDQSEFH